MGWIMAGHERSMEQEIARRLADERDFRKAKAMNCGYRGRHDDWGKCLDPKRPGDCFARVNEKPGAGTCPRGLL